MKRMILTGEPMPDEQKLLARRRALIACIILAVLALVVAVSISV